MCFSAESDGKEPITLPLSREGLLEVVAPPFSGVVMIRQGKLETAEFAGLEGSEAVLALVELDAGSFRFTPSVAPPCSPRGDRPLAPPVRPTGLQPVRVA